MVNSVYFVKRLENILQEYELSAAGFADKVSVGRATISHILSGRNKPSLDFVMKIVSAFPEVDLYWLLNGKGSFPKTANALPPSQPKIEKQRQPAHPKDGIATQDNFAQAITTSQNKKIKRIVIFLEDGTFESYDG